MIQHNNQLQRVAFCFAIRVHYNSKMDPYNSIGINERTG